MNGNLFTVIVTHRLPCFSHVLKISNRLYKILSRWIIWYYVQIKVLGYELYLYNLI